MFERTSYNANPPGVKVLADQPVGILLGGTRN